MMRQARLPGGEARWEAMFGAASRPADEPRAERRPWLLAPWEDWLILGLLIVAFLSVTAAIDRAGWASDLPALAPIGLAGLGMGFGLARVRWNEVAVHAVALPAGAAAVGAQVLAVVPGATPRARWDALYDRMDVWLHAVFEGGASSDELPFVILVVGLIWLGAYLSSWALFRWRHVWLALVPGGVAILVNVSYLPGQFSFAFVVYLFAALLLLAATAFRERALVWERDGVEYPEFGELRAVGSAMWAAFALLGGAWLLPLAGESEGLATLWDRATAPLIDRLAPYSRVFLGVDARRPLSVHRFEDLLPFQGRIELPSVQVAQLESGDALPPAPYLRARVYTEYTSSGWKTAEPAVRRVGPGDGIVTGSEAGRESREVTITLDRRQSLLLSLGQPMAVDREAVVELGGDGGDVLAVRPGETRLSPGQVYRVTGSVSVASGDELRAAGDGYPRWTAAYLDLPAGLPDRVAVLAAEVAAGRTNAYDRAAAIEAYLRTFPVDLDIETAPAGRDPVDYFLFDLRRGYFDYHASAMAVMLRTLGVPSRVAIGYALGAQDRDGEGYRVSEKRAFAWTEVFFPGYGWVEFNPTPSEPPIHRPGEAPSGGSAPANDDLLRLGDIPAAGGGFGVFPGEEAESAAAAERAGGGPRVAALAAAGALAVLAAAVALSWWGWNRGLAGLDAASRSWAKTVRLASWAGVGPEPHQTAAEYARHVTGRIDGAGPVEIIARAYERARYGGRGLDPDRERRAEEAWRNVRLRLLRRALFRR